MKFGEFRKRPRTVMTRETLRAKPKVAILIVFYHRLQFGFYRGHIE